MAQLILFLWIHLGVLGRRLSATFCLLLCSPFPPPLAESTLQRLVCCAAQEDVVLSFTQKTDFPPLGPICVCRGSTKVSASGYSQKAPIEENGKERCDGPLNLSLKHSKIEKKMRLVGEHVLRGRHHLFFLRL